MTPCSRSYKIKVEKAALRAWPGVVQKQIMGWEARFAMGHTKRANSVSPLPAQLDQDSLNKHIDASEAVYKAEGQPAIIKIPDFIYPEIDALLAKRGYALADPTLVMVRSLEGALAAEPVNIMPLSSWLPSWSACNGKNAPPPAHRMILEMRMHDTLYACVSSDSCSVSCGLGIMDQKEDGLFGIFDVTTRADVRRNGHAHRLVKGLLAAGKLAGATSCYLQVVKANIPALKLYESLGFTTLYRYWYRVQP